ncbi:(2Fe-2S)-binding protein [Streptomyces sp. ME18-1-4]|uniref:(2Fe-2S)-binding protein n=1 Tax=Streptomyces sp. ME18-1-4 TaxID=3028685 RepID=UPI0029B96271|nr:(2Fe-2S)-binding protein [Streptomyces sp. ME18-1-4]MDX3248199.1 (2Fe-2S)-binding protein [Streptomyces sp. ME18-1-4]
MVLLHFVDIDPELAALRPLGGFFVLRTLRGDPGEPPGALPTLARAYEETPDRAASDGYGDPLAFRVGKVSRALRSPEDRIAASVAQQGLAARLWSVALGCAVLYGRVPDLAPGLLRWDPDAGAPDDLWLTEVRSLPGDAATVAATVLVGHLEPLSAALRARRSVAPGLLRGNAGSALAGTARQLDQWARAHGRPDAAARARALTAELFTHPLLAGTGTLTGTAFRRRSCCLYYRVPGGGLCGDCCFTRPPRSSPRAPSG